MNKHILIFKYIIYHLNILILEKISIEKMLKKKNSNHEKLKNNKKNKKIFFFEESFFLDMPSI